MVVVDGEASVAVEKTMEGSTVTVSTSALIFEKAPPGDAADTSMEDSVRRREARRFAEPAVICILMD